jgi:Protein of unknown function, DUF488
MQDGEIELVRVLQEGEMAHIRQDQEPGVRDDCGDLFRMRLLDRLVVVAVDDENGCVDRLELIVGPGGAEAGPRCARKQCIFQFMANPFFTIGHSTRPTEEFVALLEGAEVKLVVDVRTVPRSRTNPQFNRDALLADLAAHGIAYEHFAALGGLRGKQPGVKSDVNAFWENASFHNYADYAMSEEFRSGLEKLRALGHAARSTVMCAETLWWRCHRRIISDYLIAEGEQVIHILGPGHVEQAHLTPAAQVGPVGTLTYPKDAPPMLDL